MNATQDRYRQTVEENRRKQDEGKIGVMRWEAERAQWIQGHQPYDISSYGEAAFKAHPSLHDVTQYHYDMIYSSLIQGRKLSRSIPISFLTTVMVKH